jgi:hypothetical protein
MKLLDSNEKEGLPYRYIKPEHFGQDVETLRSIFVKELEDAINSERKAINDYNIILSTCNDLLGSHADFNISNIQKIIEEIKADETDHRDKLSRIRYALVGFEKFA